MLPQLLTAQLRIYRHVKLIRQRRLLQCAPDGVYILPAHPIAHKRHVHIRERLVRAFPREPYNITSLTFSFVANTLTISAISLSLNPYAITLHLLPLPDLNAGHCLLKPYE